MPLLTYFFLALGRPWVGEFDVFTVIFICFPTQQNLVYRKHPIYCISVLHAMPTIEGLGHSILIVVFYILRSSISTSVYLGHCSIVLMVCYIVYQPVYTEAIMLSY